MGIDADGIDITYQIKDRYNIFQLNDGYQSYLIKNRCDEKQQEIFPASEPTALATLDFFSDSAQIKMFRSHLSSIDEIEVLSKFFNKRMNFDRSKMFVLKYLEKKLGADFFLKNQQMINEVLSEVNSEKIDKESLIQSLEPIRKIIFEHSQMNNGIKSEVTEESKYIEIYKKLGFEVFLDEENKVCIKLPSQSTFIARWEKLREENPRIPRMCKLERGDDIAQDVDFIYGFLYEGRLYSEGAETLHDFFFHIIPLIKILLSVEDPKESQQTYEQEYKRFKGLVEPIFLKIQEAKDSISDDERGEALCTLGFYIDAWTNSKSYEKSKMFDEPFIHNVENIWKRFNPTLGPIFYKRRFGKELNIDKLQKIWDKFL